MNKLLAIISGVGIGAALMYLFDPQDGNRRRSVIRDKATSLGNDAREAINSKTEDLSNRARGLMHEAKSALPNQTENQNTENQVM